jgi:CheY-like chemotaxis protein
MGFDPVVSESGEHAWDRIRSGQRFALVVSDVQMPGMDGPSFLEAARCLWPEIDDKAILVTGADVPETLRAGRVRCFPKPFEPDFYDYLLRVLDASR